MKPMRDLISEVLALEALLGITAHAHCRLIEPWYTPWMNRCTARNNQLLNLTQKETIAVSSTHYPLFIRMLWENRLDHCQTLVEQRGARDPAYEEATLTSRHLLVGRNGRVRR